MDSEFRELSALLIVSWGALFILGVPVSLCWGGFNKLFDSSRSIGNAMWGGFKLWTLCFVILTLYSIKFVYDYHPSFNGGA